MKKYSKVMEDYRKEILAKHVRDSRKEFNFYLQHRGAESYIAMKLWIIYSTYEKLYFELYHEKID